MMMMKLWYFEITVDHEHNQIKVNICIISAMFTYACLKGQI